MLKMKTNLNVKLLVLATLVVVSSVSALAQGRNPGKQPQGRQQNIQRQNLDQSDKLMVKAARECHAAVQTMQTALPIYHGHRINAIKASQAAIREIHAGLKGEKNNPGKESLDNGREEGGRFTDEQVRRSNARMQKAAEILLKAKGDLQAADKVYNGHRANAIGLVEKALTEIRLGLDSVKKNP